jgi:CHAD domain-containing protein
MLNKLQKKVEREAIRVLGNEKMSELDQEIEEMVENLESAIATKEGTPGKNMYEMRIAKEE